MHCRDKINDDLRANYRRSRKRRPTPRAAATRSRRTPRTLPTARGRGSRLVRARELKGEGDLRAVFRAADGSEAAELLDDWMHRAAYCKIAKVVAVEKKVRRRRGDIISVVEPGISNGRVEAINNKIKVTVRMGYDFRNTDNLVALLMLRCGDCQPSSRVAR